MKILKSRLKNAWRALTFPGRFASATAAYGDPNFLIITEWPEGQDIRDNLVVDLSVAAVTGKSGRFCPHDHE